MIYIYRSIIEFDYLIDPEINWINTQLEHGTLGTNEIELFQLFSFVMLVVDLC